MRTLLAIWILCLSSQFAHAAGIRFVTIPADTSGPALKAAIWTPCADPAQDLTIGPYVLHGRRDCPTAGNHLPLVVISHGHGGSYFGHHDLAETLADAGFVVAAINHPGDTFSDMSRAAELLEFIERPIDIKRLIDYMVSTAPEADRIDASRIGFFGFSRGGYTGLALAGGNPDFVHANVPCDDNYPICKELHQSNLPPVTVVHDARIKAYVLADPLNEFPERSDLKHVQVPIQLWASQYGGDGVLPETSPALADALPQRPEFHVVPQAAHFAFLAPCSPSLKQSAPEICDDAQGFDRTEFHHQFDQMALRFFNKSLGSQQTAKANP
ncbi:alpha/beta fold hydrolase [Paraburkholderia sp. C35]|uniref:alpha/beta hydrolase family protein n=1 Tax=Paraburkholderia sp. C35 TaxID=2126993 RepID=UPI000D685F31|nr:alpha/beta fold hydrolase [Paraburkholderia sp. C35]